MQENSPGHRAGLEPFFDFIVSINNSRLVGLLHMVRVIYWLFIEPRRKLDLPCMDYEEVLGISNGKLVYVLNNCVIMTIMG